MAGHGVLLVSVWIVFVLQVQGSAVVMQYGMHKEMQLKSHGFDFTTVWLTNAAVFGIQLSNLRHQRGLELTNKDISCSQGVTVMYFDGKKIKAMKSSLWWITWIKHASDLCELIGSDALAKQGSMLSVLIINGPLSQQQVLL